METYDAYDSPDSGMATGVLAVYAVLAIIMIASLWKIFMKAGKPGWAAIIPIYNCIVLLEIVGKPIWWIILLLIPIVNIVIAIILVHGLSVAFGKGVGMTILMILLPFIGYPVLAFGDAGYKGAQTAAPAA